MKINRLNHAVLYVRDATASAKFYCDVLGFVVVAEMPGGRAVFLKGNGSDNHHDLGLFSVGAQAGPTGAGRSTVGMYHLAWEVDSIDSLAEAAVRLQDAGAMVGASDHGVSKSLYAHDPDGLEFEVLWTVPEESWGDAIHQGMIAPLDLPAEVRRWSTAA